MLITEVQRTIKLNDRTVCSVSAHLSNAQKEGMPYTRQKVLWTNKYYQLQLKYSTIDSTKMEVSKAVLGNSHAIRDHTVLPAIWQRTFPPLPQPIKASTRFSDPGGMQG